MDLFTYFFEGSVNHGVASIPLLLTGMQLRIFKIPHRCIVWSLGLTMVINIFFWYKCKDAYIFLYQLVPYISSFVWVWADWKYTKIKAKSDSNDSKET